MLFLSLLALTLTTFTTSSPLPSSSDPCADPTATCLYDGTPVSTRSFKIWDDIDFHGSSFTWDFTQAPGSCQRTPEGWGDGRIKSIGMGPGTVCRFWSNEGCSGSTGTPKKACGNAAGGALTRCSVVLAAWGGNLDYKLKKVNSFSCALEDDLPKGWDESKFGSGK